jgi:hypothetical protein
MPNALPVLGNAITIVQHLRNLFRTNDPKVPLVTIIDEYWGGISYTGCMLFYLGHMPRIVICDPKVVEALYTTRNAVLNKHPFTK